MDKELEAFKWFLKTTWQQINNVQYEIKHRKDNVFEEYIFIFDALVAMGED